MYKLEFTPTDPNTFWLAAQINSRLVQYYETKGLQETMRKEMENEANTYLDELEKAGMIYEDAAMEDYVHCIMLSMIPKEFNSRTIWNALYTYTEISQSRYLDAKQ